MTALIHREPESQEEICKKRIIVRKQRMDIIKQGAFTPGKKLVWVTCPCKSRLSITQAFRCFFCGVYFCKVCGEIHFGERTQ